MKRVTFQGIFELQTNLEEKVLASHTCLRYSKSSSGSHNSSAHRIMCNLELPPKKGPFLGVGNEANGESGPETIQELSCSKS